MQVPESTSSTTRRRLLGASAIVLAGGAGCVLPSAASTETTSKTFDVGNSTSLAVDTTNGSVTLQQGPGDQVDVEATKRTRGDADLLQTAAVTSSRSSGTLTVRVDQSAVPDDETVSVDLDVTVPSALAVTRVESKNGSVTADGVGGDGTYRTQNGSIDVTSVDGFLTLASTNGRVTGRDVTGIDSATTTNGGIDLAFRELRTDASISSENGSVHLAVSTDVDAAVDLSTTNGDVSVTELSLSDRSGSRTAVTGTLGDGTHALEVRTTNGSVTLTTL